MRTRTLVSAFACVAVLLAASSFIGCMGTASSRTSLPVAREGVLDLRSYDIEQAGVVQLSGDWAFSWHDREPAQYVPVPRSWTDYRIGTQPLPPSGYARYTLLVLLPKGTEALAVYLVRVATAYRLYANGRPVAEIGTFGVSAAESSPRRLPLTADVRAEGGRLTLEVLASNYDDGSAGIVAPVLLGTRAQIEARRNLSVALEAIALGASSIIALFNLVVFLGRRSEIGHFWTFLLSAVGILYILANGTQLFAAMFPWRIVFRTEISSFVAHTGLVLLFLRAAYPQETPRVLAYVLAGASFLWVVFAWTAPTQIASASVAGMRVMYAVTYGCSTVIVVRCAAHRRPGIGILLAGSTIAVATFAVDFFVVLSARSTGVFVAPFGNVALFLAQSVLLSRRFAFLYDRSLSLTEELSATNRVYGKFVPMEFLRHLHRAKITEVALGDETGTDMGILFSDIRSFTAMAERLSAAEVFRFINEYLAVMEPLIRANGGFIDKYIGDGIMALFPGSPLDGLRAAARMLDGLHRLNARRASAGSTPVAAGWGVHFGPLILGIVGASERMESTVVSDAVNFASRLETLTKTYGTPILASESVASCAGSEGFLLRFVDYVRVKGKTVAQRVYELLCPEIESSHAPKVDTLDIYTVATRSYYARDFLAARAAFEEVLTRNPQDRVSRLFRSRCDKLIGNGIPADWDGAATGEEPE